jgi:hypothetical protein
MVKKLLRIPLLLSVLILSSFSVISQTGLLKNDYVVYDVSSDSGKYRIDYIFKDNFSKKVPEARPVCNTGCSTEGKSGEMQNIKSSPVRTLCIPASVSKDEKFRISPY